MNFPSQNCTVLKTYTFNSPYVLKTKSVKHCYIAITAISDIGGSLIYSEYCIASKVDNCYFVEYIIGLKTIKHTYIINMQVHYCCKKRCINTLYIFNKPS